MINKFPVQQPISSVAKPTVKSVPINPQLISEMKNLTSSVKRQLGNGEQLIQDLNKFLATSAAKGATSDSLPAALSANVQKFMVNCQETQMVTRDLLQNHGFSVKPSLTDDGRILLDHPQLGSLRTTPLADLLKNSAVINKSASVNDFLKALAPKSTDFAANDQVASLGSHKHHLPSIPSILEGVLFIMSRLVMISDLANSVLAATKQATAKLGNL